MRYPPPQLHCLLWTQVTSVNVRKTRYTACPYLQSSTRRPPATCSLTQLCIPWNQGQRHHRKQPMGRRYLCRFYIQFLSLTFLRQSPAKASTLKETQKACQSMKNAVASSSKITPDQPISNPNPPPIMPRGLRMFGEALQGLSSRAQEKSPATVLPGLQSSAPSIAKLSEPQVNGGSPPPDPKAFAYIVSGPSTNPLGIKPSSNSMIHGSQRAPPSAPKILKQATAAKKPVVVGTGWSAARTSTGGSSSASASSSSPSLSSVSSSPPLPTPPPTAPAPRVAVKTASLSQITAYSDSPSPPPPPEGDPPPKPPTPAPPSTPPPVSKWKRVAPDFRPTTTNVGPPTKHLLPASQPTLPATSNPPNSTSGAVNGQRAVSQDGGPSSYLSLWPN